MRYVITIDGPAGAGKSTVARRLADRLGWRLLDTGAMYRAVTLAAIRSAIDLSSDRALGELVGGLQINLRADGAVFLNDHDVQLEIRDVQVTRSSKYVADSPSVRGRLIDWQRAFALSQDTVTEGRDQGTIVFRTLWQNSFSRRPRKSGARRRHAEYVDRGQSSTFDEVLKDQRERDARDSARAIAPMIASDDAIVFDSTGLGLDAVVEHLAVEVRRRLRIRAEEGSLT